MLSRFPEDENTGFVIGKDIDHDNQKFRIVVSSRRLLSLMNRFDIVSADCTFKTTLQGYPLFVVCVVDAMRHAHPVALACISHQQQADYEFVFETLIDACARVHVRLDIRWFLSDGERALKNAARSSFRNCKTINCFFHVVQNVKKYFKKSDIPSPVQVDLLNDIRQLQVAPSNAHFSCAVDLFKCKYRLYPEFLNFLDKYLNTDDFAGWHEAFSPGMPSTNNGLEAINKSLKYNFLHRQREPFGTFKVKVLDIITSYSDPNRVIHYERTHDLKHERQAFEYIKSGIECRQIGPFVYMAMEDGTTITVLDINRFQRPKFADFDHYSTELRTVCRISVSEESYKQWNCTCYGFFKENVCKHILALAVQKKKMVLKPEANTTPMSTKKATGRPKHASKALVID